MSHTYCHRFCLTICLLFFFNLAAVFGAPAWSPDNALAFSIKEERELGEKLMLLIRKEAKFVEEPDLNLYVSTVGREMIKTSGGGPFDYQFFLLDDKEFNAFAAPSGLIFVHSGLIESMDSEGELVSVIAHEIAHATRRHLAGRIEDQSKMSLGAAALMLAGLAIGNAELSQAVITGGLAGVASMQLSYSRKDEEEADRLAFDWMQAEKRDPADMLEMLRTIRKISSYRRSNIPSYLLTHPEPERRMGYVQDLLETLRTGDYVKIDPFPFQRFKHRVLSLTKDPVALASRYRRILTSNQDDAMANYGLALAAAEQADYANARAAMEKALKGLPDKPVLKTDMAMILMAEGRYDEAMPLLTDAHTALPEEPLTSFQLARTHEEKGHTKEALALFEDLLKKLPNYARVHYHLGKLKSATGNTGESFYHLGMNSWLLGDQEIAKQHFREALERLPPDNPNRDKVYEMLKKKQEIDQEEIEQKQKEEQNRTPRETVPLPRRGPDLPPRLR